MLRLLRTNSLQIKFERNIRNFQNHLLERGYTAAILRKYLSEVKFADRKTALQQRNKSARKKLLPSVTQNHPALLSLKSRILMGKWHLIQNQLRLREIFKEPPLISYRMGKSLNSLSSERILSIFDHATLKNYISAAGGASNGL